MFVLSSSSPRVHPPWVAWFAGLGTTAWKLIWGCLMVGGVVKTGPRLARPAWRRSPVGARGLCLFGTTALAIEYRRVFSA